MSLEHRFSVNGTGKEGSESTLPERHRKADQALAQRYNQLAQKWADAETYLRSLHLPVPIYAGYNDRNLDSGATSWDCLAFIRYRGEWRLCHAHCNSYEAEDGDEPDWKPVADSATHIRIEAAAQLANLKIEAAKAKEKYIAQVDKALEEIDKCLSE